VSFNFTEAAISPATTFVSFSRFLPYTAYNCPNRSFVPDLELTRSAPSEISPLKTLHLLEVQNLVRLPWLKR